MKKTALNKTNKILIIVAAITLILSLLVVYVVEVSSSSVKLDISKLNNLSCNLTITDENNNKIFDASSINIAQTSSISEYTKQAFVVLEDKRFYKHHGVDFYRIGGAMYQNIKSRSYKQGASTITQQLIKNTHLSNEKTISRKLNEIYLSMQLEQKYNKEEILNMYLNTIYFGCGAYGLESAGKTYFSKSANQLTISESAMLAGIIKSPSKYNPFVNSDKAIERRNLVLKLMLENELINSDEYETAINEVIYMNSNSRILSQATKYVDLVLYEATKILNISEQELIHLDLNISTFYNKQIDDNLIETINNDTTSTINGNTPAKLGIVADNNTGGIVAYYGLGDVLNTKRQIGSTAKPIAVYLPALDSGLIHTSTPVIDEPINIAGYCPQNYGENYQGLTTIREAVKKSSNVVAVNLLNSITPKVGAEYLNKLGINIKADEQGLPLALGSIPNGVDLIELTNAYMTVANLGRLSKLSTIASISTNQNTFYNKDTSFNQVIENDSCYLLTDMLMDAARGGTAAGLAGANYQIAAKTGTVGIQNSSDNTDALIVSYTSGHTVTVWLGSDKSDPLPHSVTGGSIPTAISAKIYNSIYSDYKPAEFSVPDSIVSANIDIVELKNNKLLLSSEYTPSIESKRELFANRYMPIAISNRNNVSSTPYISGLLIDNILYITFDKQADTDYIMNIESANITNTIYLDTNQSQYKYDLNYETNYKFNVVAINRNSLIESPASNILEYYVTNNIYKPDNNTLISPLLNGIIINDIIPPDLENKITDNDKQTKDKDISLPNKDNKDTKITDKPKISPDPDDKINHKDNHKIDQPNDPNDKKIPKDNPPIITKPDTSPNIKDKEIPKDEDTDTTIRN